MIPGIAYPLYFKFPSSYLATRFTQESSLSHTYRNYCIESAVGIGGPLTAAYLINSFFGRRWIMGIPAIIYRRFPLCICSSQYGHGQFGLCMYHRNAGKIW